MGTDGRRAGHRQSDFFRDRVRFVIEVVQDFHVIRNESDRNHRDESDAFGRQFPQASTDIGFKPRLRRRAASAFLWRMTFKRKEKIDAKNDLVLAMMLFPIQRVKLLKSLHLYTNWRIN